MPYEFVTYLTLSKVEGEHLVYCARSKVSYRICKQSFELLTKLQAKDHNLRVEDHQNLETLTAVFGSKGAAKEVQRYEFIRQQGLVGCQINGCTVPLILSFVFQKWRFLLTFSLFVIVTVPLVYYIGTENRSLFTPLGTKLSWTFSILALSTIIHELGHIQAAVYFGVKQYAIGLGFYYGFPVLFTDVSSSYLLKRSERITIALAAVYFGVKQYAIGLGFYYGFPVLFTDVSSSYLLKRSERITIALAGVYFELLYSTILLLLYIVGIHPLLLPLGVLIFLKSLYNLNPFFKTDGYWVLSDYMGVYHLKQKAFEAIASRLRSSAKRNPLNWGLWLYGWSHLVFYTSFFFLVIHQLIQRWVNLKDLNWSGFDWKVFQLLGLILLSAFAIYQLINAALQAICGLRNYFSLSNLK